jgi:DNA-binding ferritin-like protein
MRTKASIAAETERLRTVATQTEQSANAADAAGDHDTADTLFAQVGKTRERLNWLHQRG